MEAEPGPAVRRRTLGRQLRELRIVAGFSTMEAAAERTGLSRATVSRIENAKQTILPRTVRLLCQAYGIGQPMLDHLLHQAAESDDRGWIVEYSDTVPNWFERYAGEEADATEIWTYEAEFVPGLLQTADYCRELRAASEPEVSDEELQRSVSLRLARQKRLATNAPPKIVAVINEAVVRRIVGSAEIMKDQLHHLVEASRRRNITMLVLPFTAGAHPAMTGSFTMLQFPPDVGAPTIFVEVDSGGLYPDRPTDLDRYTWVFDRLRKLALAPTATTALFSTLAAELNLGN